MDIHIPTMEELKRAIHLHEGIEKLRIELISLLGGTSVPASYTRAKRGKKPGKKAIQVTDGNEVGGGPTPGKKAKRTMSPEAREKIAAAQRKRWAKSKKAQKKAAV